MEVELDGDGSFHSSSRTGIPFSESKFKQQKVPACKTFLTPKYAAFVYGLFTIISLTVGIIYYQNSDMLHEYKFEYKTGDTEVLVKIPENLTGKIGVYYELSNYYQNNFLYVNSKSWDMIKGKPYDKADKGKCGKIGIDGNITYAPCGAIAMSVFNDTFSFPSEIKIKEQGIAQPNYRKLFHPLDQSYENSTLWMNENIFPGNQTNEHFINWMQPAGFPKFRKLWGLIDGDSLPAGEYKIGVNSVFEGKKKLIFAEVSWIGGKNDFFGIFFIILGSLSAVACIVFLVLHFANLTPLSRALIHQESNILDQPLVH